MWDGNEADHVLRSLRTVAVGLLLFGTVSACDIGSGGFVEPVPALIGARADGERLELWTGMPCAAVTEIELTLDPGAEDPVAEVDYVARSPQAVDRFDLATPPPGYTARSPLPDGVSWRDAEDLGIVLTLAAGKRSVRVDLEALAKVADSRGAGPGEYLIGDRVLTEQEALEGGGDDYALVCSPDPTAD